MVLKVFQLFESPVRSQTMVLLCLLKRFNFPRRRHGAWVSIIKYISFMQFFVTFSVPTPTHKYIYLFLLFFTFFIYLLRDEIEKMRLKFKSYFFKLSISILKSNYISWCKIMQNGKMCSFYTIWSKKTPTSVGVKLCIYA